jgi:hypothetical protein
MGAIRVYGWDGNGRERVFSNKLNGGNVCLI